MTHNNKNILFLGDNFSDAKIPSSINCHVVACFELEEDTEPSIFVPTKKMLETSWDLIMVWNGVNKPPSKMQQFVLQQFVWKLVPVLFFPYANVNDLQIPELLAIHPLQSGEQNSMNDKNAGMIICDKQHPVLQNIKTIKCDSLFRGSAAARADTQVLATWGDGVPMVAQRMHAMVINLCLCNSEVKNTDFFLLIEQAVQYLLHKYAKNQRMQNVLYKITAYKDIVILC